MEEVENMKENKKQLTKPQIKNLTGKKRKRRMQITMN